MKYKVKGSIVLGVPNRFVALEDLDAEMDINSAWETNRENIKVSAKRNIGSMN
jgi:hypothetical protein